MGCEIRDHLGIWNEIEAAGEVDAVPLCNVIITVLGVLENLPIIMRA